MRRVRLKLVILYLISWINGSFYSYFSVKTRVVFVSKLKENNIECFYLSGTTTILSWSTHKLDVWTQNLSLWRGIFKQDCCNSLLVLASKCYSNLFALAQTCSCAADQYWAEVTRGGFCLFIHWFYFLPEFIVNGCFLIVRCFFRSAFKRFFVT